MVRNGPPYLSVKKNSGGQREEGHGVVHHLQQEHHQSMKERSHKKIQKIRMVQNGPPYLSIKKCRWTARGRTWSSPPSSARTSSILLDAPFSKVQGWHKNLGGQPPNLPHPLTHPTENRYLNHPLGLTLSTPSLVFKLFSNHFSIICKNVTEANSPFSPISSLPDTWTWHGDWQQALSQQTSSNECGVWMFR